MRVILALSIVVAATSAFAECGCPPEAESKHVLISTAKGTSAGFVACGYEDYRSALTVRGSEFQVFPCGQQVPVLQFDALQTADFHEAGPDLIVTQVSSWPFGRRWAWQFVPVAETTLSANASEPAWRPLLPKPSVSDRDVRTFVRQYMADVQRIGRRYAPDENVVAQLFAAVAAGDVEACQLFWRMREDVNLDGAAAEVYDHARAEYGRGRPHN